ncbi:hypothetical protein M407DRAFT_242179, partial [Tulasnella calospora MUT 4182]
LSPTIIKVLLESKNAARKPDVPRQPSSKLVHINVSSPLVDRVPGVTFEGNSGTHQGRILASKDCRKEARLVDDVS